VSPFEAGERLGFSSDPSSQNYRPEPDLLAAERYARFSIESYTGERFGSRTGWREALGQGVDTLVLPDNIISVSKIDENHTTVYDPDNDLVWYYELEVSPTGRAIRVSDQIDAWEYESQAVSFTRRTGFVEVYQYRVYGVFGYNPIPADVEESCIQLMNDFLCKDSQWRTRYVQRLESTEFKIGFSKQTFYGTGNAIADRLLEKYRNVSMVVF
jgi:hypothetical protein